MEGLLSIYLLVTFLGQLLVVLQERQLAKSREHALVVSTAEATGEVAGAVMGAATGTLAVGVTGAVISEVTGAVFGAV